MIGYVTVGTNDLDKARDFYLSLLGTIGANPSVFELGMLLAFGLLGYGLRLFHFPIAPVVEAFEAQLEDVFAGRARDVAAENLQARVRGTLVMAISK